MLRFVIPLVKSWLPIWNEYLIYGLGLIILAFVPAFVYSFFRR